MDHLESKLEAVEQGIAALHRREIEAETLLLEGTADRQFLTELTGRETRPGNAPEPHNEIDFLNNLIKEN